MKALATEWPAEPAEEAVHLIDKQSSSEDVAKAVNTPRPRPSIPHKKTSKVWMTRVERDVMEDTSLSCNARLTYALICGYAGPDGEAYPSLATLAKKVRCSRKSVQRYIKELKKRGLIEVIHRMENGQRKSNRYILLRRSVGRGVGSPVSLEERPYINQGGE